MKTQGRPKNRYQTERVRSLPRRNENAQTTTRSTNPITESEAYLEGMKTWRSATERARGGGSEAYLEGMKTLFHHPSIYLLDRPKPTSKE